MNKLLFFLFLSQFWLCEGHSVKSHSKKATSDTKLQGRQYVSQNQQTQVPQSYGQYPSGYGNMMQNQFGQQQYDMSSQQINTQQMPAKPANKGHNGVLYSRRPVPDHNKDILPPGEETKKGKHKKKKSSKEKSWKKPDKNEDEEK